jgi:outer membrane lipoprotein SlyB
MNESLSRTHPLIVVAATLLILTCLLALGMLTGIVPSPHARQIEANRFGPVRPAQTTPDAAPSQNAYAPAPPAAESGLRSRAAPATGSTSAAPQERSVSGAEPAPRPSECARCGSVISVRTVKEQGDASMIGPGAGALLGGVLGNQLGHGHGKTIATVVGAGAGAAAGTEIERRYKSKTHYVVAVRMNDGRVRHFNYAAAPGVQPGDRVRVASGHLVRN